MASVGQTVLGAAVVFGLVGAFLWVKFAPVLILIGRYVAGLPLDGRPRAGGRWWAMPWWKRSAWRLGAPLAPLLAVCGVGADPGPALEVLAVLAAGAGLLGGWRTWVRIRSWRHDRTYVRPLHAALAFTLGTGALPARRYLDVPRGFDNPEAGVPVRVFLPATCTGAADVRAAVRQIVRDKLGLGDHADTWHMVGAHPYVEFRPRPRPPALVTLQAVAAAIAACPDGTVVLGQAAGGRTVTVPLDTDNPHIGVSSATGGGKSWILRSVGAQILHHGGGKIVIDPKLFSQRWAQNLPGVLYVKRTADAHDVLLKLQELADERNQFCDQFGEDADCGPRLLVEIEEANVLASRLARYWRSIKTKDDPAISPAIEALQELLCVGRAVRIHLVIVAQQLTARVSGGGEGRENLGLRLLARYTHQTWAMLVGRGVPMPAASRHRGRWVIYTGGDVTEIQTVAMSADQAVALATSGVACPADVLASPSWPHDADRPQRVETVPVPAAQAPAANLVSLREALVAGVLTGTLDAVRKLTQRDPSFPPVAGQRGRTYLYDPAALRAWAAGRNADTDADHSDSESA